MLNQNTYFGLHQIGSTLSTKSAVHIIYGDCKFIDKFYIDCMTNLSIRNVGENTQEEIESEGLSAKQFEEVLLFFI
jgi:hypothetical protein